MLSTSDFPRREGAAPLTPTGGVVTFYREGAKVVNNKMNNEKL